MKKRMIKRCLYCYTALNENEIDFHAGCSKKIFGQPVPPELPYTENNLEDLAKQVIQSQMTVTGVQPKLSLHITKGVNKNDPRRFTIVGLWGGYILKPASAHYPGTDRRESPRAAGRPATVRPVRPARWSPARPGSDRSG